MGPRRWWKAVAALAGLLALTGCGVRTDAAPRPIDDPESVLQSPSQGADAAGADRIFLVGPGENHLLRSVRREATTFESVIQVLLQGPNDRELAAQWSTSIPTGTTLNRSRPSGSTLYLDFSPELISISPILQPQAIAQIVYTASELPGIQSVQITIDGVAQPMPIGNGTSTLDSLQVFDFPDFAQTA